MDNKLRWAAAITASSGVVLLAASASAASAGAGALVGSGPDHVYGASAVAGATAEVYLADLGSDSMQLTLEISGVAAPAGTEFGAHVHSNPCGSTGAAAGPHYANGDAGANLRHREVWLDFRVDAAGNGQAVATRDWTVPDLANRSVIIHVMGTEHDTGAAGARLACIDLDG